MCALSLTAQTERYPDVEWWMHYQIPQCDLHLYFEVGVEVKDSQVRGSLTYPDVKAGKGLFAKDAYKKGALIVGFPGYWMEETVWGAENKEFRHYAFSVPSDTDWGPMHNLVYVTHSAQANYINAGVIGEEVCWHYHTCPVFWYDTSHHIHSHILHSVQVLGQVNVDFIFGDGRRPKTKKGASSKNNEAECLIKVYASRDIDAGTELLASYGKEFWSGTDAA